MSNLRKKYTEQFKEQAVLLAEKEGVPKIAKDLGITDSMLYAWRSKRQRAGTSFENQKLQHAEMQRLKRENSRLQEELSFLKKAAAYFAKDSKQGTQS